MINNIKTGTYVRMTENGEETYSFNFYTNLSAYDKLKFVNRVLDAVVGENRYNSIIRDLMFDFEIIKRFTDVDTSLIYTDVDGDKNPLNPIDDVERFLLETNIVEIVKANAFPTLFDELNKAVDDNIAYLTGIQPNSLNSALIRLFSTLEKKIDTVDLDSMAGMAQKFAGMIGELTPESVVNAYMNSDIHKKNLAEIEEAKKQKVEDEIKPITVIEGGRKSSKKSTKKTEK